MEGGSITNLSAPAVDNLFAASIGVIGNSPSELDELRALPAEKMVDDLDLQKLAERALIGGPLVGVPATDGEIVVGQPGDHFLDGTAKLMPIIIGTTAFDVPTHFPSNKLQPLEFFGPDEDAAKDAYGFGDDRFLGPIDLIQLNVEIGTDITMHEPAHFVASTMQDAGHDSWVYRFTYTAESTRPEHVEQVHAGELPFLFDNLAARYGNDVTANDQATASAFNTYIANFIKHGNPNSDGLPDWPAVSPPEFDVLDFTWKTAPSSARIHAVRQSRSLLPPRNARSSSGRLIGSRHFPTPLAPALCPGRSVRYSDYDLAKVTVLAFSFGVSCVMACPSPERSPPCNLPTIPSGSPSIIPIDPLTV